MSGWTVRECRHGDETRLVSAKAGPVRLFRKWRVRLAVAGAALGGLFGFGITIGLVAPNFGWFLYDSVHPIALFALPLLLPVINCYLGAIVGGKLDSIREPQE